LDERYGFVCSAAVGQEAATLATRSVFGGRAGSVVHPAGDTFARASATRSFEILVAAVGACIDARSSRSEDAFGDATAIWVALHGYATQRSSRPAFPWPAPDTMLARIVDGLALLDVQPAAARKRKRKSG
jgi:Tetracyclin repressor-like, C-terminal domain